jgi:ribosome-associated protein
VDLVSDKQATDVVLLDTQGVCSFTDYFVICSGESTRQVKALADAVSESLKKEKVFPLHEEGTPESGWILMDYGDLVIHIFGAFERDYYKLDELWQNACTKVRVP